MSDDPLPLSKCPECKIATEVHFLNLCSFLGPSLIRCPWCGGLAPTGRAEWLAMQSGNRRWYTKLSAIYVVLAFLLGSSCLMTGRRFLRGGQGAAGWDLRDPFLWLGGLILAAIVVIIQLDRIRRSKIRTRTVQSIMHRTLFSFDVNGQAKLIMIPAFVWGTCLAIGQFTHRLPVQRPQPATFVLIVACVLIGVVLLVKWYRDNRARAISRSTTNSAPSMELFTAATGGLEISQPLTWTYVLAVNAGDPEKTLQTSLRELGFAVDEPVSRQGERPHLEIAISERAQHTLQTFTQRLAHLGRLAERHELEVVDCSARL